MIYNSEPAPNFSARMSVQSTFWPSLQLQQPAPKETNNKSITFITKSQNASASEVQLQTRLEELTRERERMNCCESIYVQSVN